jgi:Tol biopolymer transport system component
MKVKSIEIYVMEFEDPSNIIQLTDNNVLDDEPVFSPDGTRIAFSSERDGPSNIFVMDAADGANVQRIVDSLAEDEDPAWTE